MALWDDYTEGSQKRKKLLEDRYGRRAFRVTLSSYLSKDWIQLYTKHCPHCFCRIEVFIDCIDSQMLTIFWGTQITKPDAGDTYAQTQLTTDEVLLFLLIFQQCFVVNVLFCRRTEGVTICSALSANEPSTGTALAWGQHLQTIQILPLLEIGNAVAKIQGRTGAFMVRRMLRLKLPDTRPTGRQKRKFMDVAIQRRGCRGWDGKIEGSILEGNILKEKHIEFQKSLC